MPKVALPARIGWGAWLRATHGPDAGPWIPRNVGAGRFTDRCTRTEGKVCVSVRKK